MSSIHSFKRPGHSWLIVASFVMTTPAFAQLVATPPAAAVPKVSVLTTYGKVPLSFEANQGQSDGRVKFLARGQGYGLFLTSDEAVLSLRQPARGKPSGQYSEGPQSEKAAVVRMRLAGANQHARVTGLDRQPGRSNYFIGNDPARWRRDVPNYARVKYAEVYPGIDLIYHGNQRQLEYDFVVAPGADPRRIELAFRGIDRLSLDAGGNLVLATSHGQILQHKPVVYQQIDGERKPIEGRYVLRGKRRAGFQVAGYEKTRTLVIDPVLVYSTYLGGNAEDYGNGIAVDGGGSAYITGSTNSTNFPTANAFQSITDDVFVTKLNAAGSALVYSTYLGASLRDGGNAIAVDSGGNAYVTGFTRGGFPTVIPMQANHNGGNDAFVAKITASGNGLVYSTYLGGGGEDVGNGIAVSSGGYAYVTGETSSQSGNVPFGFPNANAFQAQNAGDYDAFITSLSPTGSLIYSTFLGGSSADNGYAIAVDGFGDPYVTGRTFSSNFPTTTGAFKTAPGFGNSHPFVTKLTGFTGLGSVVYSTYLGGGIAFSGGGVSSGEGLGIAVDGSGNAYVTGDTNAGDFPTTSGAIQATYGGGTTNAFVTKLNSAGSAQVYSTYLGNSDLGHGIAVDSARNAYVAGETSSATFPTMNPIQAASGGSIDAFVAKINPTASALIYSTYLGGGGDDYARGVGLDSLGNAYIVGSTGSGDFPTAAPFQANTAGGFYDAFVTKISPLTATTTTLTSSLNPSASGDSVTFTANVTGSGVTGSVQFKDGAANLGTPVALSGGAAAYTTAALTVGSHSITAVYGGDATFYTSTSAAVSQVVQPPFGAPAGLTATSIGVFMPQVSLSWNLVGNANHYEVARRSNINGAYVIIGTPAGTSYLDVGVAANTTYLYNVRAVDGSGALSAYSNMDPATTVNFTNDPLSAGLTIVKAIHLNELRTAVNAMRTSANLAAATFTDPSVGVSTIIKAIHIQQLRNALQEARLALGLTSGAYTDTLTATTTPIKAVHFQELRDRTK